MCRMLAAVGRIDPPALKRALRLMACNRNPAYSHERRKRGVDYTHEDGWGAAWVSGGRLQVRRSPASFLMDPLTADLDGIRTDLLVLHARRASPGLSTRIENSHPFTARFGGRLWGFCHNGTVRDPERLRTLAGLRSQGDTDSERLFLHILAHFDESLGRAHDGESAEELEGPIHRALDPLTDYSAMHSFLFDQDRVHAIAWRHPERSDPLYHALFQGHADGLHVVSSEPVDGLGVEEWARIPEPGIVRLERLRPGLPD
jgi:predicted glutamine amidotransferase